MSTVFPHCCSYPSLFITASRHASQSRACSADSLVDVVRVLVAILVAKVQVASQQHHATSHNVYSGDEECTQLLAKFRAVRPPLPYSEIFLWPQNFVDFAVYTNHEHFIHQHFSALVTVVLPSLVNSPRTEMICANIGP